jgi:hypothetical protein
MPLLVVAVSSMLAPSPKIPASAFTAHLHDPRPDVSLDIAQSDLVALRDQMVALQPHLVRAHTSADTGEKVREITLFLDSVATALKSLRLEERVEDRLSQLDAAHRAIYPRSVGEVIALVIEQKLELAYMSVGRYGHGSHMTLDEYMALETAMFDEALERCLQLYHHAPLTSRLRRAALLEASKAYAGGEAPRNCDALDVLNAYTLHYPVGAGAEMQAHAPTAEQLKGALDAMPSTLSRVQYAVTSSKCLGRRGLSAEEAARQTLMIMEHSLRQGRVP